MIKLNKKIKQSLWIGIIASLLDQSYHIARNLTHQIFDIANPETIYYIGVKFLIVFVVSFIALKNVKGSIIRLVVITSIVAAFIFSIFINYLFPYAYKFDIHLLHALGIAIGVFVTLKFGEKWHLT